MRVHCKWKMTGMGKTLKRMVTHEVPWCRANSTVLMGTILAKMFPIVTEIALESKTLLSRVTRGKDVAVGAAVFLTVLLIVTIVKTLETSGVCSGREDSDLFRLRENLCRERKDGGAIGKIDSLSGFDGDRNGGFILVVIIIGGHCS